jgi:hypothetical protein
MAKWCIALLENHSRLQFSQMLGGAAGFEKA